MKSFFAAITLSLSFALLAVAQTSDINLIPKPLSSTKKEGVFVLSRSTKIFARKETERWLSGILNEAFLRSYGFKLEVVTKAPKANFISIGYAIVDMPSSSERYVIAVEPDKISLVSRGRAGLFYAAQSFLQLLPADLKSDVSIPLGEIRDEPRFKYRGMHLDVGRHFMPVEFVKKYIDLMAQYKFNFLHWGLTQDQGWRIEIKKYPKLTEIGAYRSETHEGPYTPEFKGDGKPHGGFYTQAEVKDILTYAKARFVTIIPEINVPGHSSAALAAYPQYGCKQNYEYKVQKTWGVFKEVYCPTEQTFKFLEEVFDELIKLFKDSPYIHVGGDEVMKDHWKESAFVQDLMKRENLKDEHEVQSYFIRRMEKFVNSRGKKIIGWDEILEGGVAPNATIMSWRGMKGGIEAARAKHDVIMSPTDYSYFDYRQGADAAKEPVGQSTLLPLEKVYSFDPMPKELNADEAKFILGGQGNVWSEYMKTPAAVEYMVFPRVLAMAEVLWSTPANKDYADFRRRLVFHLARLDKQNVKYRVPDPIGQ